MIIDRSEVADEHCWNVEALFPSLEAWQTAFDNAFERTEKPRWPEIAEMQGTLSDDPETLKTLLDLLFAHDRLISALYTYSHLRHDENITNNDFKIAYSRMTGILHDFAEETAWIEPEILSLDRKTLDTLVKAPALESYRFHLEKIIRLKEHTLPPEQEQLIAKSGKALQTAHKAFRAMNDADLRFGFITDSQNREHQLSHSLYGNYIRSHDRVLRENAFKQYHHKYQEHQNTLCELLDGQVQAHIFNARAHHYQNSLEAALQPKNIDVSVYHSLISAVNEEMPALHKYIALRKRVLGVDKLRPYDLYVPLIKTVDFNIPYGEAEEMVIESVSPLGSRYQNSLSQGLRDQRSVDRFENLHKRSGAYSSGCYDSYPYILMNYSDQLKDALTLAHEAGHSMHSLYTRTHQPYHYGDYPIFVAEVASTLNEELLVQLLLKRAKNKDEKIYLINQKIEDIRTTLFRQTMFAEFELLIHELAEKDVPITPMLLNEKYRELNQKYFGPLLEIDTELDIEWARIPHFYYNFYVYQYATGISAALALSTKLENGGEKEQKDYLTFLSGGCSRYPIDLLASAGVDMRSPEPVKLAISKFSGLVDQLDQLLTD